MLSTWLPPPPPHTHLHYIHLGELMREQSWVWPQSASLMSKHMASPSPSPTVSGSNLPTTCVINLALASSSSHSFTIRSQTAPEAAPNVLALWGQSIPCFPPVAHTPETCRTSTSTQCVILAMGGRGGRWKHCMCGTNTSSRLTREVIRY